MRGRSRMPWEWRTGWSVLAWKGLRKGGALSALLSPLVLDELDRKLERRSHLYVCGYFGFCETPEVLIGLTRLGPVAAQGCDVAAVEKTPPLSPG
jgi:hypothetical protein